MKHTLEQAKHSPLGDRPYLGQLEDRGLGLAHFSLLNQSGGLLVDPWLTCFFPP